MTTENNEEKQPNNNSIKTSMRRWRKAYEAAKKFVGIVRLLYWLYELLAE